MRFFIPVMFLFLLFTFNVTFAVQKGSFINKDAVLASGSSATVRSAGCDKQSGECKRKTGGSEETVFENEDYVYTNSLP
ncbi:hypothetical protein MtrunA17_Chr8g0382911 [Medicago truncatula]|uniref:Transmembrane protein, putative n=1 Tax=Medicago truncatula TaxID=3880 RepID=G7LB95_MEDTR|nr:transmembrane protein, putative [Medicago truncatula]RHN42984.1 hypothetical protein MtrunA17_Chr8g0382911 [Medicago truncatula]